MNWIQLEEDGMLVRRGIRKLQLQAIDVIVVVVVFGIQPIRVFLHCSGNIDEAEALTTRQHAGLGITTTP